MKSHVVAIGVVILLSGAGLLAQQPPEGRPPAPPMGQRGPEAMRPPDNPMEANVFPAELLMQYQVKIGLTEEQKTYIKTETQKAQAQFMDLQWKLLPETETLKSLMEKDSVEEKQVLDQLDKVLKLEAEIKKTHITMAIRIRNKLTADQIAQLKELRKASPGRSPHGRDMSTNAERMPPEAPRPPPPTGR